MESKLVTLVESSGLEEVESTSLIDRFNNYEQIAKEWENKAKAIVVTDRSQTTEMAMAKEARKKFSQLRIDVEKARIALKEQSLRKGQAIDSIAKYLTSLITPIEQHLKAQEDFIKLDDLRIEQEKAEAEAKRLEEERIAKEKAEALEQERIRKENEKLKKEAEAREAQMRKEREKADKELAKQKAKAEAERVKAEKQRQKLEEEQAKKLEAERKEREAVENELREKKEAEERAKKEEEERLKNEALEKERAAKNATYKQWLKDNNFDETKMKVERDGNTFTLWVKTSEITI